MLYGLLMTYFMESETNYEGLNFYLVDTGLAIFGLAIFNSNYKVL